MAKYTLVLFDTSGIQEYIFGSNQLVQNIGASELVELVTTLWLKQSLEILGLSHNLKWSQEKGLEYTGKTIKDVDVEAIYTGGGNAVLVFAPDKDVEGFIQEHSRRVLKQARGLQLQTIFQSFEWDAEKEVGESIASLLNSLRKKVFEQKLSRPASTPLPGLSITAACAYTGLPAAGRSIDPGLVGPEIAERFATVNENHLISKEVADKLRAEPGAKERLHHILKQVRDKGYQFVYDFDQFGEKGKSSYVAVIHTDGNGMGKRFDSLAEKFALGKQNHDYIDAVRALSKSVRDQASNALSETVNYLMDGIESGEITITPRKLNGKPLLPFRPIVFGGDDVTFVCDGRLGLQLASKYLQTFTNGKLADGEPVYARAGVAVVKNHFPFSRAYTLSEDLASNAKESINELKQANEISATVMDWHFSTTGVLRELDDIREQEYKAKSGKSLLMRPIRIDTQKSNWRTWETFEKVMKEFRAKNWAEKRNKVKDLQSALRGGSGQVTVFMKNHRIEKLPEINTQPDMKTNGWQRENDTDKDCGYFDALEALDFVAVKPKQEEE